MADASDSKSDEGDLVWVQVPSPALVLKKVRSLDFSRILAFFVVYKSHKFARLCSTYAVLFRMSSIFWKLSL